MWTETCIGVNEKYVQLQHSFQLLVPVPVLHVEYFCKETQYNMMFEMDDFVCSDSLKRKVGLTSLVLVFGLDSCYDCSIVLLEVEKTAEWDSGRLWKVKSSWL